MYVNTPDVAVLYRILQSLGGEIFCALSGVKGAAAKVNRIGAVLDGCLQGVHRAGRCQ